MKPPLTLVEAPEAANDESPKRPLYMTANIIAELVLVGIIALVAGFIFTGSLEDPVRLIGPLVVAYFIVDIINFILIGTTGFMQVKIYK